MPRPYKFYLTTTYYRNGVWQSGKKVFATILLACPLVTLLNGRKYGLYSVSHGSPTPPQSYPLITPSVVRRIIHK